MMRRFTIMGAAVVLSLLLTIGTQASRSYSAPTVKSASGDLATYVNSFVAGIPRGSSEAYDVPTASERSTMASAYDAIEAGDLLRAASLADPLGYDVVQYKDTTTGRNLIVLSERRNQDGSWPHAWGMYVFSPTASSDTTVEVPHPVADWNTEDVGVETFRKANAEDLFVAGAHRDANSDGSADVAHEADSVFEDIHEAAIGPSTKVFQPHGFSQANHPDCGEVVVSAGMSPPTQLAQKVDGDLRNAGFDTVLYDSDSSCRELGATTNVQGAFTRDVIGADFLHVEVSRPIRDDAVRRSLLVDRIAGALGSSGTQVGLLQPSQIGAQAPADIGFANLVPPQTPDKVRHVAPNGSDSNPGTRELPWRTIGKAARTLGVKQPDDTVFQVAYVHGGTYNERVTTGTGGSANAPLWLLEAPGESAVIRGDGSSGNPFIRITKPYWVVDGFEIDAGGSQNHAIRFQSDPTQGFNASHAVVRNANVHHGTGPAAVAFQGATDAALLNSKVHDYTFGLNDSHGVLVTGAADRLLIEGNESWKNDGDSVQCQKASGVAAPKNLTVEGNRYHEERENAVDIKTCTNVTVRDNKLYGFRPYTPTNSTNNSPHGDAIVVHENAAGILLEQNRIWNSGRGASIGASNGTLGPVVFRRNLVFDLATGTGLSTDTAGSGNGVRVPYTPDAEIYHNTFDNLRGTAIAVGDNDGSVDRADVINNIVQKAGAGLSRGRVSSLTVQKNLFWDTSQLVPPDSMVADPMFVDDPRNNDYFTKPGSPARDVALHEPLAVDAANSTYCHAGPDIGFLESCTSGSQPSALTYAPTNDAQVEEAYASTNYGGSSTLRTDGGAGTRVETYLQYVVTDVPAGEAVQSAKLRVYDTDNGTADGPAVYTSSTGWSESTITWSNKPAKGGSGVSDKGAIPPASWVEFDVTPLVTGNATYSFVLSQPGTDGANYASKEHDDATKRPQLVVTTGTTSSATLVGAGDIATSGSADEATAKQVRSIPGTVFTTGDNAYESGTDTEFTSLYHPTWGTEKARTKPSVGNHEYGTTDASGYFNYFGAAAGERGKGYYSYDRGDWHIIALNSMCASSDSSCDHTSQLTWLKNDLAANPTRCTLAYFHHPLFSSGEHGDTQPGGDDSYVVGWVKPLWDALYAADAEVIVNGHDHNYERFAPQTPNGTADPARGIREFIVGTGGTSLRPLKSEKANSEEFDSTAHGVLKLTLNSTSYGWEFVPVAGRTFTDSGSGSCH
jgi:acid phosphatase type 7